MKRYPIHLTLFLFVSLLVACAQPPTGVSDGGLLLAKGLAVDKVLQSGAVESTVLSIELDEAELVTVVSAFDDYAAARLTLKQIAQNPANLMGAVWQIQAEHDRLVEAYTAIQRVVEARWGDYGSAEQVRLRTWQQQAVDLEATYARFVQAVYTQLNSDARQQAVIQLLQTVAQMALVAAT